MKISLAKAKIVRNTCGLLGAALLLLHCGTGQVGYAPSGSRSASPNAIDAGPAAPAAPRVPNIVSGLMFDALSVTAQAHPNADTAYYTTTAGTLAELVDGAGSGAILEVGLNQNGSCLLGFARPQTVPSGLSGDIRFSTTDQFEALLTALDGLNAKVVLEVEPGDAPSGQLASLVMAAYGQHTSVIGFGINVAHSGVAAADAGATFSDDAAEYVLGLVQQSAAARQLYLRGSSISQMPTSMRSGVVFVDDAVSFAGQAAQLQSMQTWAAAFAPAQVAYTIGAAADAVWWCTEGNDHAAASLVAGLLAAPPANLAGVYWSADALAATFPTQHCAALTSSAASTPAAAAPVPPTPIGSAATVRTTARNAGT